MGQSFLLDCSLDLRWILRVIALVVVCGHYTEAAESPHAANLRQILDRQDAWLSSSSQGDGWNKFLHTSDLREELAKSPSDVDRRKVAKILARYKSDTPGLESPRFVATQKAISNWANECRVALVVRWAEEVRENARNAEPSGDELVEEARRDLVEATDNLESILSTADNATQEGWKSFLKWDDLDESLASDAPDWKSLQGVGGKFFDGHPGLEFPEFVRVRNALRRYIYLGSQNSKASLEAQLKELANTLDRYNAEPNTRRAGDVASLLDWMQQIGEVPELASKVRAVHNLPNLKVRISEGFLQRRFSQDVNEPMPVNECILGTHVRGTAITTGKISADLVQNPDVAQIDIVFNGTANTRSVGRQKPVTIHSTSQAKLSARKPLFIFPERIAAARTKALAWTKTTIHSIIPDRKMGRRLVEKIARKRAAEQKSQAEAIASGRTARRLEQSIDEQSGELLDRARAAMRRQLDGPINRRGLLPEQLKTLTLDSCLIVLGHQANDAQYTATTRPPNFCPQDDVVAQVHESAFNNTAEKAIAGLTLTDERIAELTKEATGSVPDELKITDEKTPWSLSFAWNQPVTVEFDDEQLRIGIRARRLTSGDRTLEFGRRGTAKYMEIAANYSMTVNSTGVHLKRQGDVEVTFAGRERLGVKERVFKTLMEKKFEEVFKTEIQGEGFTLPGQFADLGTIRLHDLSADDGWLSVGWK